MAPTMAFFSPSLALMRLVSSERKSGWGWGWGRGDEVEGEAVIHRVIMRQRQKYMVLLKYIMFLVSRQTAAKTDWRRLHNFLQGWLPFLISLFRSAALKWTVRPPPPPLPQQGRSPYKSQRLILNILLNNWEILLTKTHPPYHSLINIVKWNRKKNRKKTSI